MSYIRPVVTWAMAVLFCLAAVVQYNDPDPWLWIGIYTASVLITVWFATRTTMRASVPAIAASLALSGAAYLSTKVIGIQPLYESEEGREMMGLLIVGIWFLLMTFWSRGKPRPKIDDLM